MLSLQELRLSDNKRVAEIGFKSDAGDVHSVQFPSSELIPLFSMVSAAAADALTVGDKSLILDTRQITIGWPEDKMSACILVVTMDSGAVLNLKISWDAARALAFAITEEAASLAPPSAPDPS